MLCHTHNLNAGEGATKALYDVAAGLKNSLQARLSVVSPSSGPVEDSYAQQDISVRVEPLDLKDATNVMKGWASEYHYESTLARARAILREEQPDVAIANTLFSFYTVEAAAAEAVPCIWIIHESFTPEQMRSHFNGFTLARCERAFSQARYVVFVSEQTRQLFRRYDLTSNTLVIPNGLDPIKIDEYARSTSPAGARLVIGAPPGKTIITMVGTICDRKGQKTLVEAAALLAAERDDFFIYLVGLDESLPYALEIQKLIRASDVAGHVNLVAATPNVFPYYRAADIFAFTSRMESYSLAILEAEAFGLPIVTTNCAGITEQVRDRVNALLFGIDDAEMLADRLRALLDDPVKRAAMAKDSRQVLDCLVNHEEMIERYGALVSGCWMQRGY